MRNLAAALQSRSLEAEESTAAELLQWAVEAYPGKVALTSSFGAEDVVLLDLISSISPHPRVLTLDTGRLHQETYQLMAEIEARYGLKVEVFFPEADRVEEMVRSHGVNLFYRSVENRMLCCQVRKLEPLQRALQDVTVWITGLRREQSPHRSRISKIESQPDGRIKLNPLADWSQTEVWDYIRSRGVPYNQLHDQGYPSIGCAPCTRPVAAGEDPRSGRWWWENSHKECGLHLDRSGKPELRSLSSAENPPEGLTS